MLRLACLIVATLTLVVSGAVVVVQGQATPPNIGVPAVDGVIGALVRQDTSAVVANVEFSPRGCVAEQTVGTPPKCAPGQAVGTPVQTLFFAQCEGTFMTTSDEVRTAVSNLFAKSPASSI